MSTPQFDFAPYVQPLVQIGMSSVRQAEPDSWLDVTCYVHEIECFRGRDRLTDRFEPGTANITFKNSDGWADLVGTPSAVAARALRPGRPIRIGVRGPWNEGPVTVRWLWRGWIDQTVPNYHPTEHDVVVANCIDALGEAGSTTAPTAAFQGTNETTGGRINRVLDAVEWWTSKRKIDIDAELMQGTTLGAAGIDLMGQAADSAGGVVHGDLDGDVVYRELNWLLYDPDEPSDGTIGNVDPGTPGIPWVPSYLDGSIGYVEYTGPELARAPAPLAAPPLEYPTVIKVCASDGEGTLMEQGDAAELYVEAGQLLWRSGGRVWDLGTFDGGCVGAVLDIDGIPTRIDDPAGTDTWVTAPAPGIELTGGLPPSVDLLAWRELGLADAAQGVTTLGPVTPGLDCWMVLLLTTVGSLTNTSPMVPTVDGGGADWTFIQSNDNDGEGASSFVWVNQVGRVDPGSFSVVIDWAGEARSYAVTLWRVGNVSKGYRPNLDAGTVLRATTGSTGGAGGATPGDGPQTIELTDGDGTPGTTLAGHTVIAQSLAEESVGPYGAVFAEETPPWNVPALGGGGGPALRAETPFSDDFERPDGEEEEGAWLIGPGTGYANQVDPFTIDDGAAVNVHPHSGSFIRSTYMRWHETFSPGEQSIDALVELPYAEDDVILVTNIAYDDFGGGEIQQLFNFSFSASAIAITLTSQDASGDEGAASGFVSVDYTWSAGLQVHIRAESLADGTQRAYVDDVMVLEWVDPSPAFGTKMGFAIERAEGSSGSPRVLQIGGVAPGLEASWVAGWRTGVEQSEVAWSDVNTGELDFQSTQAAINVETLNAASPPTDGPLILGGFSNPFDGTISSAERDGGSDPNSDDPPIWDFHPPGIPGWTPSTPGAVPPGHPGTEIPGDVCPQGWEESADRSQMTTQVLIGRTMPNNLPTLSYIFTEGFAGTPPGDGNIAMDSDGATFYLYVSKQQYFEPNDVSAFLAYLKVNDTVRITVANNSGKHINFQINAPPTDHTAYVTLPVTNLDGVEGSTPLFDDPVYVDLQLTAEVPQIFTDTTGKSLYGLEVFQRTDLISVSTDLFSTIADRILEVRGINSVPRVETVTLDARTGKFVMQNMHVMSTARPEKPSRYRMRLQIDGRPVYDRMCYVAGVHHFLTNDEWTCRLNLDIAEWAAQL